MERTNILAARLGVSLRGLAPRMGLSVASLFGYRNGSIPISTKGWGKLEHLERSAGLGAPAKYAAWSTNPKESGGGGSASNTIGGSPMTDNEVAGLQEVVGSLEARVGQLEHVLAQMAAAVVAVLERTEDRETQRPKAGLTESHELNR